MVYLRVAGLAQAHKVVSRMSAALGNGKNVVNLLHRCQPTVLETMFAQRMLCGVTVTDALPRSAVLAVDIGATLVFIIFAAFLRAVLFTELSFAEVGAAGMRAGSEWSLWHLLTSFGHNKSPTGLLP